MMASLVVVQFASADVVAILSIPVIPLLMTLKRRADEEWEEMTEQLAADIARVAAGAPPEQRAVLAELERLVTTDIQAATRRMQELPKGYFVPKAAT